MTPYRRERFEAVVAVAIWAAAAVVAVGVSIWVGSEQPTKALGGVPLWIVVGVLAPWVAFLVIHVWYTLFFMSDDESDEA